MKLAILVVAGCLALGCAKGPDAPAPLAQTKVAPKPDPLLGTWVCIADNGGGFKGAKLELKADGTATYTFKGKTTLKKYRREAGRDWAARRKKELGWGNGSSALNELIGENRSDAWREYEIPGVEMVYFRGPDGKFLDTGGNLLQFVPQIPALYNFLTQAWCRPGDEKRVTAIMSK